MRGAEKLLKCLEVGDVGLRETETVPPEQLVQAVFLQTAVIDIIEDIDPGDLHARIEQVFSDAGRDKDGGTGH